MLWRISERQSNDQGGNGVKKSDSPCFGCETRCLLCHAQCKEYHEWVEEQRKRKAYENHYAEADAHTKSVTNVIRKRMHMKGGGQL